MREDLQAMKLVTVRIKSWSEEIHTWNLED